MNASIPARMRHLDVDRRGFAIPWGVYRDSDGNPHFAINDERARLRMLKEGLCSICGDKLWRGRWFVGGPLSAFHEEGCYIDPPMHHECMRYAMQVCPYLAARRYEKRVDHRTMQTKALASAEAERGRLMILVDPTVIPERPALFVAIMSVGQTTWKDGAQIYVRPVRPYRNVEYWRSGELLPRAAGEALVEAALRAESPHSGSTRRSK